MNFSALSDRSWVGRLARLPLRAIPPEMKLPILQGRLRGKKWIAGSSVHGCWLGSYEYNKRQVFEKVVASGSVVFDIGANVGYYTLLAAVLVGPRGKVVAFEPVPDNLRYLKEHLRLNHIANVSVIEGAVSDHSGEMFFAEGGNLSEGHIAAEGKLQVKVFSLDDLTSDDILPLPAYMKIDVEGAEVSVLTGARKLVERARPTIFLATHSRILHQQCCDLLRSMNYELRPLGTDSIEQADELFAQHACRAAVMRTVMAVKTCQW